MLRSVFDCFVHIMEHLHLNHLQEARALLYDLHVKNFFLFRTPLMKVHFTNLKARLLLHGVCNWGQELNGLVMFQEWHRDLSLHFIDWENMFDRVHDNLGLRTEGWSGDAHIGPNYPARPVMNLGIILDDNGENLNVEGGGGDGDIGSRELFGYAQPGPINLTVNEILIQMNINGQSRLDYQLIILTNNNGANVQKNPETTSVLEGNRDFVNIRNGLLMIQKANNDAEVVQTALQMIAQSMINGAEGENAPRMFAIAYVNGSNIRNIFETVAHALGHVNDTNIRNIPRMVAQALANIKGANVQMAPHLDGFNFTDDLEDDQDGDLRWLLKDVRLSSLKEGVQAADERGKKLLHPGSLHLAHTMRELVLGS